MDVRQWSAGAAWLGAVGSVPSSGSLTTSALKHKVPPAKPSVVLYLVPVRPKAIDIQPAEIRRTGADEDLEAQKSQTTMPSEGSRHPISTQRIAPPNYKLLNACFRMRVYARRHRVRTERDVTRADRT